MYESDDSFADYLGLSQEFEIFLPDFYIFRPKILRVRTPGLYDFHGRRIRTKVVKKTTYKPFYPSDQLAVNSFAKREVTPKKHQANRVSGVLINGFVVPVNLLITLRR